MYIGDDIAIASDNTCGETTTLDTNSMGTESVGSALQATPPFSFRESLAPIPFSIVKKVQALEYVDLAELLPGNRELLQCLEATENKGSDTTSCRKLILSNHLGPVIYGLCSNSAAKTPLTYTRATGVQ